VSGFEIARWMFIGLVILGIVALVLWWRYPYTDDRSLAIGIACFVLGFCALAVGAMWAAVAADGVSCKNNAAEMGLPFKYSFSTSCKVYDDGRGIPIDQLINNRESNGG